MERPETDQQPDVMGRLPGWYAAMEGRTEELKIALDNGLDADHAGKDHMSLLAVAAFYSRTDCVSLLLDRKADPNKVNKHGNGPLWEATREASKVTQPGETPYDKTIVAMLLAAGADPLHANKAATVPAMWAGLTPELRQIYRDGGFAGEFPQ